MRKNGKTRMLRVKDISWAAGFLEGEGCFTTGPQVTAGQRQREPLLRLQSIFGGVIDRYIDNGGFNNSIMYRWRTCGRQGVGVMLTVFPLMSIRRKKRIKQLVKKWLSAPGYGHNRRNKKCKRMHLYKFYANGRKRCLTCERSGKIKNE